MNLESKEKLFREFSHFSVGEQDPSKVFTHRQRGEYVGGVPLAYDAQRKLMAIDSSDTHTLVWGSTGSLKTRCVIEPAVKIIGKSGESMIINDPKAEIHNRCAAELKKKAIRLSSSTSATRSWATPGTRSRFPIVFIFPGIWTGQPNLPTTLPIT